MTKKNHKGEEPLGDADPKVMPMQDMYLSPKRQCTAMSKASHKQCQRYAMVGLRVCYMHGGATRQARAKAAQRIQEASGYAADMLVEFMADPDTDVKVRTQIAQDLLDRSGINTKTIMELQPKSMSAFERAVLSSVVDVDDDGNATPAFVDDGEGGMRAISPGTITGDVYIRPGYGDEVIEDAVIVPDDYEPPTSRHDRAVFAEVEQGRAAERKRMQSGGLGEAERKQREAEALATATATARSTLDPTVARAAYQEALDNGATTEEAERAGRAAAERATNPGKRRARTSRADMSQG